jgi:hypothetical protein
MIKVPESFMFSHEKFIALFFDPLQARKTAKIEGCLLFLGQFLPTRFAEDPINGTINYDDIFSKHHWLKYCYRVTFDGSYEACKEDNDTDKD